MNDDDAATRNDRRKKPRRFLNVQEAADYLGLKRSTLDRFRWSGGGPRYRKHGGRVKYAPADLKAWSECRRFQDTATRVK